MSILGLCKLFGFEQTQMPESFPMAEEACCTGHGLFAGPNLLEKAVRGLLNPQDENSWLIMSP